jgi:hypothetical protein
VTCAHMPERSGTGAALAEGLLAAPASGGGAACPQVGVAIAAAMIVNKQIPLLDVHDRPFRGSSKTVPMQIYVL